MTWRREIREPLHELGNLIQVEMWQRDLEGDYAEAFLCYTESVLKADNCTVREEEGREQLALVRGWVERLK